ncbi:hypothetical protein B0H13DRAFT_1936773, partial [Mycena leptocephala]
MNQLPNELLNRICLYLDAEDLWNVHQVSSRLRGIASLPFLSRFGLSRENLESGTLSLDDSFHVILVAAQIHPIQRLVSSIGSQAQYRRLAAVFSVAAVIPDVVLYKRCHSRTVKLSPAELLSRIPHAANNPLLIIVWGNVTLSRPRRSSPPMEWEVNPPRPTAVFWSFSSTTRIFLLLFGSPFLFAYYVFAYFIFALANAPFILLWLYRRLFGPGWAAVERILSDAGLLVWEDCMRIQVLPGQKLTLVELPSQRTPELTLNPLHGLTEDVYPVLLPTLDLSVYLKTLTIETKSDVDHAALMVFLERHLHVTKLCVQHNSIRASSLVDLPIPRQSGSEIRTLIAPATYIHYLLPAAPNANVLRISIRGSTASDIAAYRKAVEAIAVLPGTHPLTLTLSFRLTKSSVPWSRRAIRDSDVEARHAPETRLTRVQELTLCPEEPTRFHPAAMRALVPWLGLFPQLQRVSFAHWSVQNVSLVDRMALTAAICEACTGISSAENVVFNYYERIP